MHFGEKKLYTRSYIYCIKILKSAIFIYMYKTIYLLQKTNQWTSFKPVSNQFLNRKTKPKLVSLQ
jgi:hypothetical protein